MSEDDSVDREIRVELNDVFRDFETAIWAHINGPDTDDTRREVAELVAEKLAQIQHNVATELNILS